MPRSLDTLAQRLKFARNQRSMNQEQLADAAGMQQGDISKLETGRSQSTAGIARLAAALQVPALWLELGHEPSPDWSAKTLPHERGGDFLKLDALAHDLSQSDDIMLPKTTIAWEALMDRELPKSFRLQIRDNAMAPDVRSGQTVVMVTGEKPVVGDFVLVCDSEKNVFFREYQERRPGDWLAVPKAPGYQPLESRRDGLEVLAIFYGVFGPRGAR